MENDVCFRCGSKGHWAKNCPVQSSNGYSAKDSPPKIHCNCGDVCIVKVSKTSKNPNRKFYKCPNHRGCGFFKWCDQEIGPTVTAERVPMCPCGAGVCRREMAKDGPNAGRSYFTCTIREGFGACGFFQWEDSSPSPEPTGNDDQKQDHICDDLDPTSIENYMITEKGESPPRLPSSENMPWIHSQNASLSAENQNVGPYNKVLSGGIIISSLRRFFNRVSLSCACPLRGLPQNHYSGSQTRSGGCQLSSASDKPQQSSQSVFSLDFVKQCHEEYSAETTLFNSISQRYAESLGSLLESYRRREVLRQRVINLKEQLTKTQNELMGCEAETRGFEASLGEISNALSESRAKMEAAYDKLSKVLTTYQQKDLRQEL